MDLQQAFSRAYDDCGFESRVDYRKDPAVQFGTEIRGRLAQVLRERTG